MVDGDDADAPSGPALPPRYARDCHLAASLVCLPEAEFTAWLRQHIRLDAGQSVNEAPACYAR
ncbi:MAG: hypothetical protein J0I71_04035 [Rhodanobacter sp.]|jgi:hypothetical protein|nr:hypothetical protein [Rhodanobacter sp.]ODT93485.1 MAG: hypothetical protein ABS82_12325 [Rhodanobacter sp. SCN 67-45]OJW41921.1 MAG: hypothetical protein BGO50_02655 [Rhodanobacter sp. 67-28]